MLVKISVIIPVYNGEGLVGETLDSLLRQGGLERLELVVVNDGSKDGSGRVIGDWVAVNGVKFGGVKFLDLVENVGVAAARNRGLDVAGGEWVMMLDGDDVLMDGALGKWVEWLEGDGDSGAGVGVANLDVIYSPLKIGSDVVGKEYGALDFERELRGGREFYEYYRAHGRTGVSVDASCGILFRRDLLERYDLRYTVGMMYLEDGEFLGRVFSVASGCVYQREPFYLYRVHGGSVSFNQKIFDYPALGGYMRGIRSLKMFAERWLDEEGKRFLRVVEIKITLLPFQAVVGKWGIDWKKHRWVSKEMREGGFYPLTEEADSWFYVGWAKRVNRWVLGYYIQWWLFIMKQAVKGKLGL